MTRSGAMGWLRSACIGLVWLLAWSACNAAQSDAQECTRKAGEPPGHWQEIRRGEFIFRYSLEGAHALQAPAPAPGSNTPAVVADAMRQLETARGIFRELGYQLPLESPRYRSQGATHILVRFENIRQNGLAFDEVGRLPSGECVLHITISNRYRTGNLTPAHEYFHQIQNGYTLFKRPWFYEGTARWAESVLGDRPSSIRDLTLPEDIERVWRESYSAVTAWHALAEQCADSGQQMHLAPHWFTERYTNGEPVVLDDLLPGHRFMLRVLQALGKLSDGTTQVDGLTPHRWPEALQRDPRHDPAMWQAVMQACRL